MTQEGEQSVRHCPRCGAENPSFTRECACGQRLIPSDLSGSVTAQGLGPAGGSSGGGIGPDPGHERPRELDASWARAAHVWWAITWRTLAVGVSLGIGLGCLVIVMAVLVGADQQTIARWTLPLSLLISPVGVVVHIWAIRAALRKHFGEFRVVLIRR